MTTSRTKSSVALVGKMGAGKTTASEYLQKHHGYTPFSFASTLKRLCVELWGPSALKDRDKMQGVGKSLRDIDELVWVNATFKYVEGQELPEPLVVDDCRFPNEYWALKQKGFVTVRVVAEEELRVDRLQRNGKLQDVSQLKHESEVALDDYGMDYSINNGNGVDRYELWGQIEAILEHTDTWLVG